jgi:hypothetical protein
MGSAEDVTARIGDATAGTGHATASTSLFVAGTEPAIASTSPPAASSGDAVASTAPATASRRQSVLLMPGLRRMKDASRDWQTRMSACPFAFYKRTVRCILSDGFTTLQRESAGARNGCDGCILRVGEVANNGSD